MATFLHQLPSESAARDPGHLAVVGPECAPLVGVAAPGQLTYGELDAAANRVAHALIRAGVRPGDRVGLFLPKSLEAIIAIFGVQKAGAAYVPVDPHAPPLRAAYILGNCGVSAIIGSVHQVQKLPPEAFAHAGLRALLLVEDGKAAPEAAAHLVVRSFAQIAREEAATDPAVRITDNDLAYILYTSGSTGEPKGVMISHLNSFTFVNWAFDTFRPTPADRISGHAPLHFDLSVFDVFCTMKAGATLYLVPNDLHIFPGQLARWIARQRLTIWYSVPSALIQFLEHGKLGKEDYSALRIVLFAGEVFPLKYLRRLVEAWPHPAYYNLYGPTETNVCTYHHVQPEDLAPEKTEPVPIGIACENQQGFAIKEDGGVAEVGEEGELYIRSHTVMKGYWGRPLSETRSVVPNFLNPHYSEVLYNTGDIVRVLPGGGFQYKGRKDKMIKSRGYRIEIGEIEAAFHAHSSVREVAVIAVPDDEIGARIVAWLSADDGLEKAALEKFLSDRIPRYMMPEKLHFEPALPKTSTGKIDKALLERKSKQDEQH